MKRLSILVALILCVTIGGVYAAWLYTGSTVSSVDRTISHGLTTATTDGDVGIFRVKSNTVDIAIDQTAEDNYLAKLVITGQVVVSFTPNPGAPEDVINNAVSAVATVYTKNAEANLYDGSPIYSSPAGSKVALVWEKLPDGTFEATITAEQIDTLLDLGAEFVLDSHADYLAFHELEENITITLAISQGT